MSFYAIGSIKNDDGVDNHDLQVNIPVELLNNLNPSGLAPYKLNLKVGRIVMLLRDLLVNKGLCNGTRMILRAFRQKVLQLEIITGAFLESFTLFLEILWIHQMIRHFYSILLDTSFQFGLHIR